jgi:CubicO group peptidase (beta-lactamase class C family)
MKFKSKLLIFLLAAIVFLLIDLSSTITPTARVSSSNNSLPVSIRLTNSDSENESFAKFDQMVKGFLSSNGVKGASVAIARDGKLLYAKGYGYANVEDKVETEPYHIFRIASASKLITAVAVMRLVDKGMLSLESKVFGPEGVLTDSLYTSYLDSRIEEITVKQLLNHSAGWTTRYGDQLFMHESIARQLGKELPITKDDIITFAFSKRLHFSPGSRSSYNNLGYLFAERVIEKVAAQGYEQFVKEQIFSPLGIFDAYIAQNFDSLRYSSEVRYYEVPEAKPVPAFDGSAQILLKARGGNNVRDLGGAGGWVISSVSLMKFILALEDESQNSPLSAEVMEILSQTEQGFQPIGWRAISPNKNKWRTGSFAGTSTLIMSRNDGLRYVFITNTSPWQGAKFPHQIDRFMSSAFGRINEWPERNLFSQEEVVHQTAIWPNFNIPYIESKVESLNEEEPNDEVNLSGSYFQSVVPELE